MKKILAVFLTVLSLLLITGCESDASDKEKKANSEEKSIKVIHEDSRERYTIFERKGNFKVTYYPIGRGNDTVYTIKYGNKTKKIILSENDRIEINGDVKMEYKNLDE